VRLRQRLNGDARLGAGYAHGRHGRSTYVAAGPANHSARAQLTQTAPNGGEDELAADIANFAQVDLTVEVGTTIRWTNRDGATHTTTAGEPGNETGTWDSGRLNRDESFSFTFNEAGTFQYFCKIHPATMRAAATATPTPPAPPTAIPTATPTATAEPTAIAEDPAVQSVEIGASKDNTLYENAGG
jgi:plastocyanin